MPNFQFYLAGERVASFRGAKKDQLLAKLQQLSEAQEELAAQAAAQEEEGAFMPDPASMLVGA